MQSSPVSRLNASDLRSDIVGIDTSVPLLNGSTQRYVFLDNAASTPTFRSVLKTLEEFMPWYSGVHRGTGTKAVVATEAYEEAHHIISNFIGADPAQNIVVVVKNTTEAINKLSNRMELQPDDIVVTTAMEHHSNDLPWRRHARVIHVGTKEDGHLDLEEMQQTLKTYKGKVKVVAITGASNITGICNPIYTIARWAHEAGAKIFVDAAQLAPHRPISVRPNNDPEHIDFIAFSAHKMYAPFGAGVLVGPRSFFEQGEPDMVGGGVVDTVTLYGVRWSEPPGREEAGSPNVPGAITLAKAILMLQEAGLDNIASHEYQLLQYTYDLLKQIPGVTLYGPTSDLTDKVGVIPFNVEGKHHGLVAAIFNQEGGIGLRDGCFCAQPYIRQLLNIRPECDTSLEEDPNHRNEAKRLGMVRASLGCYTSMEDIDRFLDSLRRIVNNEFTGEYVGDTRTGVYTAKNYPAPRPQQYFTISGNKTIGLGDTVTITA